MHKKYTLLLTILSLVLTASAQDKWDLKRCVEYALANNISVKQADVQARNADLTLKQSKQSQYPSVNVSANTSLNGGRSIDPTTNLFVQQQILSAGFGLNSSMSIFNFFSLRNTIEGNKINSEAERANVDRIKNDISLNVATAYLVVLVSQEQANISEVAVQQTLQNLNNVKKRVDAGALPELNLAEIEAQLARDSSALVTAQATVQQNVLQLKALLNLDAAQPFVVDMPPLDRIPVDPIASLQPEVVYQLALANLPQQKLATLRIQAAEKYASSARGRMYPSLNMFAGLGTNYSNISLPVSVTRTPTGVFQPTDAKVTVGGVDYNVQTQVFENSVVTGRTPFGLQFSDNFRQNIGVSLNVPVFNWGTQKTAYRRSLLDVENLQLQKELDATTIKQNVYRAYNDAVAALQKFEASKRSVAASQKAYDYSQKRYDLGMLSTIDFLTNQNNLTRSKVQAALDQVDYVFRLKLLEFYKGMGIRLE